MNMNLKINRPNHETKDKVVTLRLTAQEQETLASMKDDLEFDSVRDLFLFCLSAVAQLRDWNRSQFAFYVGNREKGDLKEIEFEFKPGFNNK
jgi:hypothetical protein